MAFSDFLNKTVYTYTFTEGSPPAYEETWVLKESPRSGAKHNLSGAARVVDPTKNIEADIRVFVESSTGIEGDRVQIDNKIYEIVFIDDPMEREHHFEFKCMWLPNENLSGYPTS